MSKNSKKRRDARKRRQSTPLSGHQRVGKTLVPPLNRLPATQKTRWSFDRMPDLLWACLVRALIPRDDALQLFRQVIVAHRELLAKVELSPEDSVPTHTNLAGRYPEFIDRIVQIIVAHPLGYAPLRLMLMFDALPARDIWAQSINAEPENDGEALSDAISPFLWHQSQEATDIRWLCVMCAIVAGKMRFPEGSEEMLEEFRLYPDYGDQRSVRPSVRALEQTLWVMADHGHKWPNAFWHECHHRSACIAAAPEAASPPTPTAADAGPVIVDAINTLSQHWINTAQTTDIDAKHEGTFAIVLYALRCLLEMVGKGRIRISGRLLLRTIVECRITLAYLYAKRDDALWSTFRHYGSGQAKLALLKISEAARQPHSISTQDLERIANEDLWDEFVDINLGSWAGADLRRMAEQSGTKQLYDTYYGWNSGFSHGHWAAVRDAALTTCLNPLHRLHRIPLVGLRELGDTFPDAVGIVKSMIGVLLSEYPGPEVGLNISPVPTNTNA